MNEKKENSSLAPTMFRVGDYEWCDPDYRQILVWARETGLKPEEVVARYIHALMVSKAPFTLIFAKPEKPDESAFQY